MVKHWKNKYYFI